MRGKQDSYHCQLESFHKQSKICIYIYIFILAPKFNKVFPVQRVGSSFLHAFYILKIIYIKRRFLHGIQKVHTFHRSKIRDKLQGGMIYNNCCPILEGPLGTSSSYLGAICPKPVGMYLSPPENSF
jgi:hypothetical protein